MKTLIKSLALVSLVSLVAGCASCKDGCDCDDCMEEGATALNSKPVNTVCPIGKEALGATPAAFTTYDGSTVGFCCAGCVEEFAAWDEEKKAAFVTAAREGNDARLYGDN